MQDMRGLKREVILIFLISVCFIAILNLNNISALSYNDLKNLSESMKGTALPKEAAAIFGNQRIDLYINLSNGSLLSVNLETVNGKFSEIKNGLSSNLTIRAYTSERVLAKIIKSDNPTKEFMNSLLVKEITYNAVGFKNKIKFFFVKAFIGFYFKNQTEIKNETGFNYKILHTAEDNKIYVVDWNGSNPVYLGTGQYGMWSPDGKKIAYSGIHVVNSDGTGNTIISNGYVPYWSPDGKKIAYKNLQNNSIYVYNFETDQENFVAADSNLLGWFSDNQRLYISTKPEGDLSYVGNYYSINLDGTNQTFLMSLTNAPILSPKNDNLLYRSSGEFVGFGYTVYVSSLNNNNPVQIDYGYNHEWSPEGKVVYQTRDYSTRIRTVDLANTITINGTGIGFSPDGTKIAYNRLYAINNSFRTQGLFVANSDGTEEIFLARGSDADWSPDSKKILFTRYISAGSPSDVYVIDADGSNELKLGNWNDFRMPQWQPN
jgi:Tol biopolymer transport system component